MYFILHKDFRIFWWVFAYLDGFHHNISRNLRNHSHNQALFWNGNIHGKIHAYSKSNNLFVHTFLKVHHLFDSILIFRQLLSFLCKHYRIYYQKDYAIHLEIINVRTLRFDKEQWVFPSCKFALKHVSN